MALQRKRKEKRRRVNMVLPVDAASAVAGISEFSGLWFSCGLQQERAVNPAMFNHGGGAPPASARHDPECPAGTPAQLSGGPAGSIQIVSSHLAVSA